MREKSVLLERFELHRIKRLAPHKLLTKELIAFAESDSDFLKKHLGLFPSKYLAERFKDEAVRKSFIGNRVHTANKTADHILTRKLEEASKV